MTTNDALFNLRSCTENMQTVLESSKRAAGLYRATPTLPPQLANAAAWRRC